MTIQRVKLLLNPRGYAFSGSTAGYAFSSSTAVLTTLNASTPALPSSANTMIAIAQGSTSVSSLPAYSRPPPLQRRLAATCTIPCRPHRRDLPQRQRAGHSTLPRHHRISLLPRLRRNHPRCRISRPLLLPLCFLPHRRTTSKLSKFRLQIRSSPHRQQRHVTDEKDA